MVESVAGEKNAAFAEMDLKSDTRDRMQRIVKPEGAAVDVHRRSEDHGPEFEQLFDDILRHG